MHPAAPLSEWDSMDQIVDAAIPAVIFIMMIVVGHGLTFSELRRSLTDFRAVVAATIGQLVLLPLIATIIVLVFEPAPAVVAGLILVAACPAERSPTSTPASRAPTVRCR